MISSVDLKRKAILAFTGVNLAVNLALSAQHFLYKKAGQKFLYLSKPSSTNFGLESNSNFLNRKSRPESPIDAFHTLPETTTSKISAVWGLNYNDLRYVKISRLFGRMSLKSKTLYQSENLKSLLPKFFIERREVCLLQST